jgi:hypothetical protein
MRENLKEEILLIYCTFSLIALNEARFTVEKQSSTTSAPG